MFEGRAAIGYDLGYDARKFYFYNDQLKNRHVEGLQIAFGVSERMQADQAAAYCNRTATGLVQASTQRTK